MNALISWVCRVDHAAQTGDEYLALITVHEHNWAYCIRGGASRHRWERIEPTAVEMIRQGRGVVHHVGEESTPRRVV